MLKRIRALLGNRGAKASDDTATVRPEPPRPPVHHGPKVVHWPIVTSDLDADAVKIVRRLTRFDHRAYLVGGCVRDVLLDRKPKDFDVGTSATPRQMKRLFRNCRIIGRRFRLAHIYFQNGKIIEVATFRRLEGQDPADPDAESQDLLIRDDNVFGTPEEDALRRDFTINQLFYDMGDQTVLDHADGLADLRRKLVRTIGDPDIRFREDPIRILRAIKFAARLGFQIESKTLASLRRNRLELNKAAAPRVLEEINRFCRGGAAQRSFELMGETGVLEVVFSEISKAYTRRPEAWSLTLGLLGRMDNGRSAHRGEIRTGEIIAAALLPVLAPQVGWNDDGTVSRPGGLNLRLLIDEVLKPMALRLRIPRREQEHCRQILGTLFRMVPSRGVRRSMLRAVLNRECLPDVLGILEVLSERLGQDFSEAHRFWAAERPQARPQDGASPEGPKRAAGTRGRRRRSRRKAPTDRAKATVPPPEQDERPGEEGEQGDRPPPWHDDSFFAALPSAPELAGDDTKGDRHGAAAAEPPAENAERTDLKSVPGSQKPKRRRRRRRRRAGSSEKPVEAKSPESDQPDPSHPNQAPPKE